MTGQTDGGKENAQKIHWEGTVTALSGGIRLSMTAGYFDMKVPLNIEIYSFGAISQIPGTREEELIAASLASRSSPMCWKRRFPPKWRITPMRSDRKSVV